MNEGFSGGRGVIRRIGPAVAVAWLATGCMAPMHGGMSHGMGGMSHGGGGDHADHAAASQPAAAPSGSAPTLAAPAERWVCPMGHFSGDRPGQCPTCGMDLVKDAGAVPPSGPVSGTGLK